MAKVQLVWFKLLGSGSEWTKDQALLLTMISYLEKKIKIKMEKRKKNPVSCFKNSLIEIHFYPLG